MASNTGNADDDRIAADALADEVREVARRDGTDAAAALIGKHWDTYASTAPAQLLEAIRALPGEVFVDNAGMVAAAKYLRQVALDGDPGRFGHDERLVVDAHEGGSLSEQLILLTSVSASARTSGDLARAREAATEARRRLSSADGRVKADMEANLPHLMLQWGRAFDAAGVTGATYEYEESHRLALLTRQPQAARRAASHLAWHHGDGGRLPSSAEWLERAQTTGEVSERYDAVLHLAAALLHLEAGDEGSADAELARVNAQTVGEYFAAELWVRALRARGSVELTEAESRFHSELERQPPSVVWSGANARYIRAAQLRLGLPMSAVDASSTVDDWALDGLAAYRRGDFHNAIEHSRDATVADVSPRTRATAALVTAAAAHALGRPVAAAASFDHARAVINHSGIQTTYELVDYSHLQALASAVPGAPLVLGRAPDVRHEAARLGTLAAREREVLAYLATDRSFSDIATEMFISTNTVKNTAQHVYRKLGVNSRAEAADVAHRSGFRLDP